MLDEHNWMCNLIKNKIHFKVGACLQRLVHCLVYQNCIREFWLSFVKFYFKLGKMRGNPSLSTIELPNGNEIPIFDQVSMNISLVLWQLISSNIRQDGKENMTSCHTQHTKWVHYVPFPKPQFLLWSKLQKKFLKA